MDNLDNIISLMRSGEALKNLDRSGWKLAGISNGRNESVAEHSYGTILTSLLIVHYLSKRQQKVDLAKVLVMAILHDIQETITGDIPRTAENQKNEDFMQQKTRIEKDAIHRMLDNHDDYFDSFISAWDEYSDGKTLEARIVRGADILDMILHARSLESSTGESDKLEQFFESSKGLVEALDLDIVSEIFIKLQEEHYMENEISSSSDE